MKNIIILGEPRSGKSTLANMIVDKYHYQVIRVDALRDTFYKIYPELDISPDRAILNEKFQLFLQQFLDASIEESRNLYGYVLEGCETSPADCFRLFHNKNNLIYYLAPLDITIEDFFQEIRTHDTSLDWTFQLSDEDLKKHISETLKKASVLKDECNKYNIPFVDTGSHREDKLNEILKDIEHHMD